MSYIISETQLGFRNSIGTSSQPYCLTGNPDSLIRQNSWHNTEWDKH